MAVHLIGELARREEAEGRVAVPGVGLPHLELDENQCVAHKKAREVFHGHFGVDLMELSEDIRDDGEDVGVFCPVRV